MLLWRIAQVICEKRKYFTVHKKGMRWLYQVELLLIWMNGHDVDAFAKGLLTQIFRMFISLICKDSHNSCLFYTVRKKCPYSEFFRSVFSSIRTEYGEMQCTSPYSVRLWENTDQKDSEYGHFLRSVKTQTFVTLTQIRIDIGMQSFRSI